MFNLFPISSPYLENNNEPAYFSYSAPYLPSAEQLSNQNEVIIVFNKLSRAMLSSDKNYIEFKIKKSMKEDILPTLELAGYALKELPVKDKKFIKLKIMW